MKLFIVGFGPGHPDGMTLEAQRVLEESQVILGYSLYIDLIKPLFPGKIFLNTPMKREEERCRMAVGETLKGQTVSLVCSGDSGVYGMAGLVYEIAQDYPPVEMEVIPGVTAALSGGALLGAPLGHDFAVVSLSDLLTPWEVIERRLHAAAQGDFVLALYNPSSKKRAGYLKAACDILLETKPPETVCGIARNIGREGQSTQVVTLGELRRMETDMFSTVFIGNAQTLNVNGKMVTPRGYPLKKEPG